MVTAEPRCPKCGECRLIEREPIPRWTRIVQWVCKVCAHTWTVHAEVQ